MKDEGWGSGGGDMFILQEEYDEESHRCMVSKVLFPTTSHVSQVFGKDQMIGNQNEKRFK